MSEELLTRGEHLEFSARMEAENKRQNARLEKLEDNNEHITSLTIAIQELTHNVQSIATETERLNTMMENSIKEMDTRLKKIEDADGEKWRKVTMYVVTCIIGIIIGFIFKQFGM